MSSLVPWSEAVEMCRASFLTLASGLAATIVSLPSTLTESESFSTGAVDEPGSSDVLEYVLTVPLGFDGVYAASILALAAGDRPTLPFFGSG
jgi:hypothetical protein